MSLIASRKSHAAIFVRQAELKVADFGGGPKWIEKLTRLDAWDLLHFEGLRL